MVPSFFPSPEAAPRRAPRPFSRLRRSLLFLLPLLFAGLFGEPPEITMIDGRKAAADRVLARSIAGEEGARLQFSRSAQDSLGVTVETEIDLVPGLVALRLEERPGARSTDDPGSDLVARIKELRESGLFEYVEPDWVVTAFQTVPPLPDDAAFVDGRLWGLQNEGQDGGTAGVDVNAAPAWEITTGASEVVVGVVDSGIRYTHDDISANMWTNPGEIPDNGIDDDGNGIVDDVFGMNAINNSGDPDDDDDHGSHVAGTISATGFAGGPHVGVAYNARVMGLKFLNDIGIGFTSDAIRAIDYGVDEGARILNNSWGGGGFSNALLDSIEEANEAGVLFVAAAGNDAADNDSTDSYPANYDVENVISVAAVDRRGDLASFSNFGAETVDIGAPGVSIFSLTAQSDTSYANFNGTSMASPHVAGVAALLVADDPAVGIPELRKRLLSTANPLASLDGKTVTGGMVDAEAALLAGPDGVLELEARTAEPLVEGQPGTFFVEVTDLSPVTGATVTGSLDGGPSSPFRDDGVPPDQTAGDAIYSATLAVPADTNTTTLEVEASAPGKDDATASFPFEVFGPPPNDDFADRITLSVDTTETNGSNRFATAEAGEPLEPAKSGPPSVWWEWNAPEGGPATLNTFGSTFDTTLAVYEGDSLGGLKLVAANDDADATFQSEVTFAAEAGKAYVVQVNGFEGATGSIALSYPGPGSDDPGGVFLRSQPEDVTVRHGRAFALEIDAGGEEPIDYQWFRGLPSDEAPEPIPGANGPRYSVASAEESDEGSYFVRVSNAVNEAESAGAFVTVLPPSAPLPSNDDFGDAQVLSGIEASAAGENREATGQPGEPNHAGAAEPLSSVWYRWDAPDDGVLRVNTFDSDFDTVLAVYSGPAVDALVPVAANDDADGTLQSSLETRVEAGVSYSIAVDGFGDDEGEIALRLEFLEDRGGAAANDDFADRAPISGGGSQVVFGSSTDATGEEGEPNHAGVANPIQSVWWTWTAPAAGPVAVSTAGSDFDTVLAAYQGTAVDALTLVAANDDWDRTTLQSEVRFVADAGETYAIAVDGFGPATGAIRLSLAGPAGGGGTAFSDWLDELLPPDADAADRAPDAAPFGDGIPNLVRYAMGMGVGGTGTPVRVARASGVETAAVETMGVETAGVETTGVAFDLRSDDPALSATVASSTDLADWNRQSLDFDSGSGAWTLAPGPMTLEGAVERNPGIWELTVRPEGYASDEAFFVRLEFELVE